jgi:hypothetical protein
MIDDAAHSVGHSRDQGSLLDALERRPRPPQSGFLHYPRFAAVPDAPFAR